MSEESQNRFLIFTKTVEFIALFFEIIVSIKYDTRYKSRRNTLMSGQTTRYNNYYFNISPIPFSQQSNDKSTNQLFQCSLALARGRL